ncbi:hypothetical protein [Nocardioides sp.]|uniref:hypothetical protein n=1 Tax=Nocardioides sp. TaxID=35761 RepID=UPI00321B61A8
MSKRLVLSLVLALPALSLAGAGFFHPHGLTYDTSQQWSSLHFPGLLAFPLVGASLAWLVRGRNDTLAWVVRLTAVTYAAFYSALDVINGIAAGYVTHRLGPGVPRPDEIRYLFDIGRPLGDIGEWGLIACCLAVTVDQVLRHRLWGAPAAAMVLGAWFVRGDHIFTPIGVVGMAIIGVVSGYLAWHDPRIFAARRMDPDSERELVGARQ